jgi:monofunctional biosynthetic peptidoglycan transglycosylase
MMQQEQEKNQPKEQPKPSRFRKFLRIVLYTFAALTAFAVLQVLAYKFIPPPVTPLMVLRVIEGAFEGKAVGINYDWEAHEDISPHFFRAVVAAEDGRFMRHSGFDWKAIENARKRNERSNGKKKFGASTITMQTSKNVFLWHGRNYVRKGLEAIFTVAIEFVWGKKRIIEMYANVIEFGEGIYGVRAASLHFFNKEPKRLTRQEAALLAAVLPNPRRWSPAAPTAYIKKRQQWIMTRMNGVAIPKAD